MKGLVFRKYKKGENIPKPNQTVTSVTVDDLAYFMSDAEPGSVKFKMQKEWIQKNPKAAQKWWEDHRHLFVAGNRILPEVKIEDKFEPSTLLEPSGDTKPFPRRLNTKEEAQSHYKVRSGIDEGIDVATSLLPGLGDIKDSYDIIKNQDEKGLALAALGIIPGGKIGKFLKNLPFVKKMVVDKTYKDFKSLVMSPEFERRAKEYGYTPGQIKLLRENVDKARPSITNDPTLIPSNADAVNHTFVPFTGKGTVYIKENVPYERLFPSTVHELDHAMMKNNLMFNDKVIDDLKDLIKDSEGKTLSEKVKSTGQYPELAKVLEYLEEPTEVKARLQEIRHVINPSNPYRKITLKDLENKEKELKSIPSLNMIFEIIPDKQKLVDVLNRMFIPVGATAIIASSDKKSKGGLIFKKGSSIPKYPGSGTKDDCYYKAKKSYKVFPSAYASGMIAKCRKAKMKK